MLRLLGSRKELCSGVSRRDLLHVGGLGLFGVGLSNYFELAQTQAAAHGTHPHFGKAKSCILLYLFGSPAQHETWDPKPQAPEEIQGELKATHTALPGISIGEGLPKVAKVLDRVTLVRTLTHAFPLHGVTYAVSGVPTVDPSIEADPRDVRLWPFIGSVVDYMHQRRDGAFMPPVPRNIAMPWVFYSRCNFRPIGGPYASFLGGQYDPVWTNFPDQGTKVSCKVDDRQEGLFRDPYEAIDPGSRLTLSGAGEIPKDVPPQRFESRRSLLAQFDEKRKAADGERSVKAYSTYQQMAYSLLTSAKVREALDVKRESAETREQYGMTLFGQSTLAARRLVEAGSKFVTVFWDAYGYNTGGWDTHSYHFPRLKSLLLPGFDQTFSALILDLERRGLLDETLVLVLSEHGRSPKILNNVPGGGRDHWSRTYPAVLAGGGIARGKVVGRTDSSGGDIVSTPMSPKDILATAFHLLGIDPATTLHNHLNRPVGISGDGIVRPELLA